LLSSIRLIKGSTDEINGREKINKRMKRESFYANYSIRPVTHLPSKLGAVFVGRA
jgi:hypothetical protein